jgi:hypothetical protein
MPTFDAYLVKSLKSRVWESLILIKAGNVYLKKNVLCLSLSKIFWSEKFTDIYEILTDYVNQNVFFLYLQREYVAIINIF